MNMYRYSLLRSMNFVNFSQRNLFYKEEMDMKKRLLSLVLVLAFCLSLTGCLEDDYEGEYEEEYGQEEEDFWGDLFSEEPSAREQYGEIGEIGDPNETWAIYWYLCGSDLESEYGAATEDLNEMLSVSLPENIKVVIETGGAAWWLNDFVDESVLERYVYEGDELSLVDQQPLSNMGDPETFADFLQFCEINYPADKTMVVFWNHGGGSVTGVSFDENYDYDSLTLSEMRSAFESVYDLSQQPPLEAIGFDTCLMGTVDTAAVFSDIASYLIASEEMEPGLGWYYTGWLEALAQNPGMDGARLGQHICDTFLAECDEQWQGGEVTLSVVDLSRIQPLLEAYEAMGAEAMTHALVDPGFFSTFGREAEQAENYGGNTRDQGYSNMVDLGDLARHCQEILPQSAGAVQQALKDCVLYEVNGPFRESASGLSCYYSYNADLDELAAYMEEGCSQAFKTLYTYGLGGEITDAEMAYVSAIGYELDQLPYVPDLPEDGQEDYPLSIDDEGYVVLSLDADTVNMLKGVYFELAYVDEQEDLMLLLGQDNDIEADWDTGIFRDNFRGVWGALDGNLVYMEVYYECDAYTAYSVPILLNGEGYSLRVAYDYEDERFYILGARKGMADCGMADKNLVQLRPGDQVTTLHYASTISGDDDFQEVEVDTFTVTENTSFSEVELGDGVFLLMFQMVDGKNNEAYSEMVQFTVSGENMDVEILE